MTGQRHHSSPDQTAEVAAAVADVRSAKELSRSEVHTHLEVLSAYECWNPAIQMLERQIQRGRDVVDNSICLATLFTIDLGDLELGAKVCRSMLGHNRLSFEEFQQRIFPKIMPRNDFAAESFVNEKLLGDFSEKRDRIACLERLCWLFEKKVPNDRKLHQFYDQLLSADPGNIKALRFFKMVHTQNLEWEEVAVTLTRLLRLPQRKHQHYRDAHELAVIYLYHLDMPDKAIEVLNEYCSDSPLDMSAVFYDAYERMGDQEGCLRLFRQMLLKTDNARERAVLHYRIADIEQHLGQHESAVDQFERAVELAPGFLEPLEGLILLYLNKRDWVSVALCLERMGEVIESQELKEQIYSTRNRLKDAISAIRTSQVR